MYEERDIMQKDLNARKGSDIPLIRKGAVQKGSYSMYYEIVKTTQLGIFTAKHAKISLPRVSKKNRKKILDGILDESKAFAMMEFWQRRSIVYKPMFEFYVILLYDT